MPVCGYLIATLGWESVFYVTGVVGLLWSIVWFLVVFDSPAQHPRISPEEREYIESAIGDATSHGKDALVGLSSSLAALEKCHMETPSMRQLTFLQQLKPK
ncbi:Vesicular glutamate transporter 3 [Blattella germanica]|nr:Vesicular glutamate transporter 3 [Blattella germanica]